MERKKNKYYLLHPNKDDIALYEGGGHSIGWVGGMESSKGSLCFPSSYQGGNHPDRLSVYHTFLSDGRSPKYSFYLLTSYFYSMKHLSVLEGVRI